MRFQLLASVVVLATGTSLVRAADPVPLKALPAIDPAAVLAHQSVASDAYEGRPPHRRRGEDVRLPRRPVHQLGSSRQPDGTFGRSAARRHHRDAGADDDHRRCRRRTATLRWRDDVVAWTKRVTDQAAIDRSELVFVGYGVEAPEFDWDDYKGVDVAGKTLVMLVNDPAVPDPQTPAALDARTFGGRAMTTTAAGPTSTKSREEKGGGGAPRPRDGPAGYPFAVVQGRTGEQSPSTRRAGAWTASPSKAGSRSIRPRPAGPRRQDFDQLKARRATRAFRPVPLG